MSNSLIVRLVCLLIFAVLWAPPAMAQSLDTKTSPDATEALDHGNVAILAGPSSVGGQLDKDRETKGASDPAPHLSERYFSFKNRIENVYGFSFGFDYNALFQAASDSLGEDKAAGGVFRAYGQL